jgi:type I restriction enzyme S subunit
MSSAGSRGGRPWVRKTLREWLPIRYGKARSPTHGYVREDTPVYGSSGEIGQYDRALTNGPTLIVGRKGNVGSAHYCAEPCWPIDTVFYSDQSDDRDLRFFKYLFEHLKLGKLDRSTAVPGLSRNDYNDLEVTLPEDLPEQHRIVEEIEKQLTRLEAGVAALERVRANLKRYRAAVLKAACEGRLVPTEAELAREEGRSYEPASVLLERTRAERARVAAAHRQPRPVRVTHATADLPSLPEGWAWTRFDEVTQRVTVGHVGPMKHEYVESGIPFLRSQNVRPNRFDPSGLLFIGPKFHDSLFKSRLHPGDLVVVRSGAVGTTCVIPESLADANCADLVIIQGPIGFIPQWGAFYMNSLAHRYVQAGKVGVALTHFNTKSVAALPLPLPPLSEQLRIVAEVERRLSVADGLGRIVASNSYRAARLRQSILASAFGGRVAPSSYDAVSTEEADQPRAAEPPAAYGIESEAK